MSDLVLWVGPVMASNLSAAKFERETAIHTVPGVGSDLFANKAKALRPGIVRKLAAQWCNQRLPPRPAPENIALCSFSAGHGLVELAAQESESLERLSAVGAFDSYYVSKQGDIKPGYRAACERAARGEMLVILTTSHNTGLLPDGKTVFPSSAAALGTLFDALELPAVTWQDHPTIPAPIAVRGKGLCWWFDYGDHFTHGQHATKLAAAFNTAMIGPYLAGKMSTPAPSSDDGGLLALLALASLGVLL